MMPEIKKLSKLFKAMVNNGHTFGAVWKNIELGTQAFALMKSLPPTLEGEFDTPADKAFLLSQMLEQMEETATPRFCIEVREYIHGLNPDDEKKEKNYRSSLSIREVAENCYVSNSTLSRLFTQNLGISFYQYVTQKRLSAAEEMMKTGISLKEAAFQSGFSDYPSFYRAFRGHYGISPLEYRHIVKISR